MNIMKLDSNFNHNTHVFTPLKVSSVEELNQILVNSNIDTGSWIKSVTALYNEIENNECCFGIQDGKLHRRVDVVRVKCFHTNQQGDRLQLLEEKQVFKNGNTRERGNKYVAEKLQLNEFPEQGALRGLKEELQVSGQDVQVFPLSEEDSFENKESPTYKGIECSYNTYAFTCEISKKHFKESYVEDQIDKQTFFTWIKI